MVKTVHCWEEYMYFTFIPLVYIHGMVLMTDNLLSLYKFYHTVNRSFICCCCILLICSYIKILISFYQDWFTECARLISQVCGQNVEWVTPLGLPVVQPYSRPNRKLEVKSSAQKIKEHYALDMFE